MFVVQVGKVHGSPLTITWYQETDEGDQKLEKSEAGNARNSGFNVDGTFDGKHFKLQLLETYVDGGTSGLLNYTLLNVGPPHNQAILTVPVIAPGGAEGQVSTSVASNNVCHARPAYSHDALHRL